MQQSQAVDGALAYGVHLRLVAGAALGSDLPLTKAEWYERFRAAGYRVP